MQRSVSKLNTNYNSIIINYSTPLFYHLRTHYMPLTKPFSTLIHHIHVLTSSSIVIVLTTKSKLCSLYQVTKESKKHNHNRDLELITIHLQNSRKHIKINKSLDKTTHNTKTHLWDTKPNQNWQKQT